MSSYHFGIVPAKHAKGRESEKAKDIQYYPIDISNPLVFRAFSRVSRALNLDVSTLEFSRTLGPVGVAVRLAWIAQKYSAASHVTREKCGLVMCMESWGSVTAL